MTNKTNCVGSYAVSGYTRSDGTEVSSYVRTCGAKHDGGSERHKSRKGLVGAAANLWVNDIDKILTNIEQRVNNGDFYRIQAFVAEKLRLSTVFFKYYGLALNFEDVKKFDRENTYTTFGKLSSKLKAVLKETCDLAIDDNTAIVTPQFGSSLYIKILESPEFNDIIQRNMLKIKSGELKNKKLPIAFNYTSDIRLTLGHATLYNLHYNYGAICGMIIDAYDFEHKKLDLLNKILNVHNVNELKVLSNEVISKSINNNAYQQQYRKKLKNYLIVMPIVKFE